MHTTVKRKMKGLEGPLELFSRKIAGLDLKDDNTAAFAGVVISEMKRLGFDEVTRDKAGNIMGIVKGYENKEDLVLISHMDSPNPQRESLVGFKAGIITSLYAAALMKKTLFPLSGDLVVCCVPRQECCDYGIKYLFDNFLKKRLGSIKGVLLCEPTDLNVYLGHKGRMEYEIIVKGRIDREFLENRGVNMLGAMFPLINELEKVSKTLPSDCTLGASSLRIKDVSYSGYEPQDEQKEFKLVVDRNFIPEEDSGAILKRAKLIAKNIYKGEPDIAVNTALATSRIRTSAGLEIISEKEIKPWMIEVNHPFVASSVEVLKENGINARTGHWKKIVTEGSYTFGQLKIPTIGFGVGSEEALESSCGSLTMDELERAVLGQALIAQRNIGMPTFGWSEDEI